MEVKGVRSQREQNCLPLLVRRVQVQVPPEHVCGATHACPQLPQFFGSEPVSVHESPQQATGQVICMNHCPVAAHACSSVPTHWVWPAVQTPMHRPLMHVCPVQVGSGVHAHVEGLQM
jgi:hypothetical protein